MVKIAPSILAADSACLGNEATLLQQADADLIHFDVMDGHFVPNITFGPKILKDMKKYTSLPFDVHLMVNEPQLFVPWYADAGADIITFHLEATNTPVEIINLIHSYGVKCGVSLKPETNLSLLEPLLNNIDMVLVMSVAPGFGGQKFISETPAKIKNIKNIIGKRNIIIEVDGGITPDTAKSCINAGADILVAGTSVFAGGTYNENIQKLKGE